jgi:hypothetical protein
LIHQDNGEYRHGGAGVSFINDHQLWRLAQELVTVALALYEVRTDNGERMNFKQ